MTKLSWTFLNAAACVVLSVGTAQARTLEPVQGMQPAVLTDEGQTHDDLLDGLDKLGANAKEKNEVNLDKNMMALTAGRKGGRFSDLSSKMDLITVRNYEFATKGMYSKSDLDALRKKLDSNGWSHIVRNESEGEANDIAVKATSDGYISDMVILNAEAKELNIVHLRGHFRMEDVNGAMGATMGLSHGAGAGAMGTLGALGASSSSHRVPPEPPAPPAPPK
jgi:Domain of unknown function (DUF4252)